MAHSYRVVNIGKEIAEKEGLNVEDLMIACLLHDASEAYMSDVTTPVKNNLSDYSEFENKLKISVDIIRK